MAAGLHPGGLEVWFPLLGRPFVLDRVDATGTGDGMGAAKLAEVITRVEQVAAAGGRPVVVFDLDSTLIDTAHRHLRVLREFALIEGDLALTDLVSRLVPADMGYRVDHALLVRGLNDPALSSRLHAYWAPRYFSDAYCSGDLPTLGAVSYVQTVYDAGGWVYYLTARPRSLMSQGTVAALVSCGFPVLCGRTFLQLKHDDRLSDTAFKHGALQDVAASGEVVATFENEPAHANAFYEAFPGGLHFLLQTVHSPNAPAPHPDVVLTRDFRVP